MTAPIAPAQPHEATATRVAAATARAVPRRRLHALGTDVAISGDGADQAAAELLRLEALLTRFAPSPVTRLNDAGELSPAPAELIAALRHALAVASKTDGVITPLVLPALRWAGYRRSWPAPPEPQPGDPPAIADWREVRISGNRIRLPRGGAVDLGGTGKSWIAQRSFERLRGEALIDAGGDVVTRSGATVAIDVAHPAGDEPLQLLLPAGCWGVATSGVLARAWRGGHHLIDPRTARPADTRFVQVSAVHPDLRHAEVLAKLALLRPDAAGLEDATVLLAFDAHGAVWRRRDGRWGRA
ncbi:MAG TPA: FAD:protein FMN transferase [Trueperaceae bacterium]|nr:FAD:protein FMN transferase [Trueperaceae bacterium]